MSITKRPKGVRVALAATAAVALTSVLPVGVSQVSAVETVEVDFTTTAGEDRYDTAARIALATFTAPVENIVLAVGTNYPDALAGNALAGAADAPILLTRTDALPTFTSDAITALAADDGSTVVHVLGGEAAISQSVRDELAALGVVVNNAFNGEDRFETAISIAEFMDENLTIGTSLTGSKTAFVTTSENFADAVAVGPSAYHGKFPVYLVPSAPGANDPVMDRVIASMMDVGIDSVIILGGEMAVSADVFAQLAQEFGPDKIDRIGGENRYETATLIADFAAQLLAFNKQNVLLARGDDFADALAAGPHGGVIKAPIMLALPDSLPDATAAWLDANDNIIRLIRRIGGDAAISRAVLDEARAAASTLAAYRLGDRTDAPELQFVRLVEGEPFVADYVFDTEVSAQSLFEQGQNGEYLNVRLYSNTCQVALVDDDDDAATPPVPVPSGILSTPHYAEQVAIQGNGNVVRARFGVEVEKTSRATVRYGTVEDEDIGLNSIEGAYPVRPTHCSTVIEGSDETRLVAVTNWDNFQTVNDDQAISVDFVFDNFNPDPDANDFPFWLLDDEDTIDGSGDANPADGTYADSGPYARQFFLVGNNSSVFRGARIVVNGTEELADGAGYQVRVAFERVNNVIVNESALRRGYVDVDEGLDNDQAEDDLVMSARYVQSSGITVDPDLVTVVETTLPLPGFAGYEFNFDEAISNDAAELREGRFHLFDTDLNVSDPAVQVVWKTNAAGRTAIAYFDVRNDGRIRGLQSETAVAGFVEAPAGQICEGAVRGTDNPTNQNCGWSRPASAFVQPIFDPEVELKAVIPAGYTSGADLYQVTRVQDTVTQNWQVTFTFDDFGANICDTARVFFDVYDPNGTQGRYPLSPFMYVDGDLQNAPRVDCDRDTNSITFDGGTGAAFFTNDQIETMVIGGVEGAMMGDNGPELAQLVECRGECRPRSRVSEGSAIVNEGVRFPDSTDDFKYELVEAGAS